MPTMGTHPLSRGHWLVGAAELLEQGGDVFPVRESRDAVLHESAGAVREVQALQFPRLF